MLSAEVGGGHGEAEMRRGKWLKKYLNPDTKHKFLAARDLASSDYEKASATSHTTQELHDLIDDGVKAGVINSKVAPDLKKQIQRYRGEHIETQPAFSRQGQLAPGRGTEHRQKAAKILSYLRQRDPATARGLRSYAYGSPPENRGKVIYTRNSQTRDNAREQLETLVEHGYKDRITGVLTESPKTNIRNTRAFRENVLDVVKKLKNSLGASAYASGNAVGPRATFRNAARDAIKKVQAITKSPRGRDHSNRPEFHQALRDIQKVQYGYVKYPEVNYNKQGQANPETKVPRHLSGHKREVVNKAIERPIEVVSRARWSSNLEHNRTTGVFNKQRVSQKLTPNAHSGTVEETDRSSKMTPDKPQKEAKAHGKSYEWAVETLAGKNHPVMEEGEVIEVNHFASYKEAMDWQKDFPPEKNARHSTSLYLNHVGKKRGQHVKANAFVNNGVLDKTLTSQGDGSPWVDTPQKYAKEVEAYHKKKRRT